MAAPPPLLGFNNNVRHKGRIFHIQTEDSGINHPRIVTHLFADGGRIVKTARTDYAEHVGRGDMTDVVRRLMKDQHKGMFVALRAGELDELIEKACGPAQEAKSEPQAAPAPAPAAEPAAAPPEAPAASAAAPPSSGLPDLPPSRPSRALSNPNLRRLPPSVPPPPVEIAPPPPLRATPTFGTPVVARGEDRKAPPAPPTTSIAPETRAPATTAGKSADQTGRYAASRPTTIFADAPKPTSQSIFGDGVMSEKSLDEVILSYLAEDLAEEADKK